MNEAEAFEAWADLHGYYSDEYYYFQGSKHKRHYDVKAQEGWQAALEWRDSQVGEPVAYYTCEGNWPRVVLAIDGNEGEYETPLYTTPPTAQINQQFVNALERAETEMRYAEWNTPIADNLGRVEAYKCVEAALAAANAPART